MQWQFQYKEAVWLFATVGLLLLIYVRYQYWRKKTALRFGDAPLIKQLISAWSPKRAHFRFVLILLAMTAGILAVMNPRKPGEPDNKIRKGIDVAIALDVSKSMLATDLAPTRLDRAKQFIGKLMDDMPDDRIALVLFAGKAYLQMPLTADHGAAMLFTDGASPDAVPQQGTVISDALHMSAGVFNPQDKRFKTIILVTDGEDHDADAVHTAKELAEKGIMINTIGIGSAEGSLLTDQLTGMPKRDETGNPVLSKINEPLLREIATATNGVYQRLQGSDEAVKMVHNQLAQIDRKAYGDTSLMDFHSYYMWFAAAMLLLLLAAFTIPVTLNRQPA